VIFALFDAYCRELFRVVYNGNAYNGNGVSPQGVITAYAPTQTAAVPQGASTTVVTASYRTDCSVTQQI
jgi:hypothetical protein